MADHPLDERTGFKKDFAAAVEATASTGGQIMPPVMVRPPLSCQNIQGFLYSDLYSCCHSALLYYFALFMAVHFEASRTASWESPKRRDPDFNRDVSQGASLFSIDRHRLLHDSRLHANVCLHLCYLSVVLIAVLRAETRMGVKKILKALEFGAKNMLPWQRPAPAPVSSLESSI